MSIEWDTNDISDGWEEDAERRLRLNAEWATLIALRDTLGIALKGARNRSATYRQAFAIGEILIPQLFDPETSLLNKQKLSETARKYIQMAEANSKIEQRPISPVELIKADIALYDKLLEQETLPEDMNLVRRDSINMMSALRELQKRKSSENSLIFTDAYQVTRGLPISGTGRNYREYKISDERALRIRVLHPDKAEHATGVDLIYENYWETRNAKLVRLTALQYKLWRNKALNMDERVEKQLRRMKDTFCDNSICDEGVESRRKGAYRLPYCSAFLRPSEQLQSEDASLLSTGCYVPICVVNKRQQPTLKGNSILHSKQIRSEAVSHQIFEEMFNTNMLGSRWLTYDELENLYRSCNVLEPDENIVIHAQELPFG